MARATAPVCHGRPMKLDPKSGRYSCKKCGAWTIRATEVAG